MTEEFKKLNKLKKVELVNFILLMTFAMETRPYKIAMPSEKSKTKYMYVFDRKTTRWENLSKFIKFAIQTIKDILQ